MVNLQAQTEKKNIKKRKERNGCVVIDSVCWRWWILVAAVGTIIILELKVLLLGQVGEEKLVLEIGRSALRYTDAKPHVHDFLLSMALAEVR